MHGRSAATGRATSTSSPRGTSIARKVGRDVAEAIFAKPNCTEGVLRHDRADSGVIVRMGRVLDGISEHMARLCRRPHLPASPTPREPTKAEVVAELARRRRRSAAELPAGRLAGRRPSSMPNARSKPGSAFVNNMPVFIASDPGMGRALRRRRRADHRRRHQVAARRHHRPPRADRPVRQARRQARPRPTSSTPAAIPTSSTCRTARGWRRRRPPRPRRCSRSLPTRLDDENIHVGPSDYVPWQNDNKVCFLRMEGQLFGDVPMNLELRLSVEDSPNSRGRGDRHDPLRQARARPRHGRRRWSPPPHISASTRRCR